MRVDFSSGRSNYFDHLAPIWFTLDASERGDFYAPRSLLPYLAERGVLAVAGRPPRHGSPLVVASYADLRAVKPRPVILVNHGVGQRYDGDPMSARNAAYSGGEDRETVVLHLCPSEQDAEVCRQGAPWARAEAIGSPKLDRYHRDAPWRNLAARRTHIPEVLGSNPGGATGRGTLPDGVTSSAPSGSASPPAPTIAISWHWDCRICEESRWAFPHFRSVLPELAAAPDFHLIGHGHPRAWRRLKSFYESAGIEPVSSIEEVIERAQVFVCDNSSAQYETASAGLLQVVMNAPAYRRDVHHGLRFWDTIPGPMVDHPEDLLPTIRAILRDPSEAEQLRLRAAGRAYAFADGRAAERAAEAIRQVLSQTGPTEAVRETNPKAPTTTRGGPGQKPVPIFPKARLVRLGATEAVLGTIRARWDEMPPEDQLEQVKELASLNDAQLRELIADTPVSEPSTILGIPQGLA